jgi:hypothetical protein
MEDEVDQGILGQLLLARWNMSMGKIRVDACSTDFKRGYNVAKGIHRLPPKNQVWIAPNEGPASAKVYSTIFGSS